MKKLLLASMATGLCMAINCQSYLLTIDFIRVQFLLVRSDIKKVFLLTTNLLPARLKQNL